MAAPRVAVLLAAGLGSRLGAPKPLVRVEGRPLAWYPLAVLHLLGVSEAVIVARGSLAGELEKVAAGIYGGGGVSVVINDEAWRENGYSLLLAISRAGLWSAEAFVSMSDHVYSPLLPQRLAANAPGWPAYSVACDPQPGHVDVEEATKLAGSPPVLAASSKRLQRWRCIDTGVHLYQARWSQLLEAAEEAEGLHGGRLALISLVDRLASRGAAGLVEAGSPPWTEVDTPRDLEALVRGPRRRVLSHVLSWLHS